MVTMATWIFSGFLLVLSGAGIQDVSGFGTQSGHGNYHGMPVHYKHHRARRQTTSCDVTTKFSRLDGQCNNLNNPTWGLMETNLKRFISVGNTTKPCLLDTVGNALPSARKVSLAYHGTSDARGTKTLMHMQFGQFLDHDLTSTPTMEFNDTLDRCNSSSVDALSMPISLSNDEFFRRPCLPFVRSTRVLDDETQTMENMNLLTSYLDGSNIYGSGEGNRNRLADPTTGLMLTSTFKNSTDSFLPERPNNAGCSSATPADEYCFLAGDNRVNVQPALAAMHTIFMREHNRIATKLTALNPSWSGNDIYDETRKIVSAILQRITYSEYLPTTLGSKYMDKYSLTGKSYKYNQTMSAAIMNSFSTAAFRYGHSQIPETYMVGGKELLFKDLFFVPSLVLNEMIDLLQSSEEEMEMKPDRHFAHSITRHLFQQPGNEQSGHDLIARNIQRGRDHSLPSYNDFRVQCGLTKMKDLKDIYTDVPGTGHVYASIDDVDLFSGAMSESLVDGGSVGDTFACIIGEQFKRLKHGDRFFYEARSGPGAFSDAQIEQINKMSLAKVICENSENKDIQGQIFHPADKSNPTVKCDTLPDIDLTSWKDTGSGPGSNTTGNGDGTGNNDGGSGGTGNGGGGSGGSGSGGSGNGGSGNGGSGSGGQNRNGRRRG